MIVGSSSLHGFLTQQIFMKISLTRLTVGSKQMLIGAVLMLGT